jgi:hypothetical protein
VGRQDLVQFGQGGDGRLLQASDAAIDGTPQTDDDGSRFVVIEKQRREATTPTELVTAESAGYRLNRVAQVAEPLNVAPDRSLCDVESSC